MSWNGDEIRHSLARQGIHVKKGKWFETCNIPGLDNLVDSYVWGIGKPIDPTEVTHFSAKFQPRGAEIVVDASRYLATGAELTAKQVKAAILKAPAFVLLNENELYRDGKCNVYDNTFIAVGRGGCFVHPKLMEDGMPYPDNHYLAPISYSGPSIIFPEPVILYGSVREQGNKTIVHDIPFMIAGLVGLEGVVNEASAKLPERQLAGVA